MTSPSLCPLVSFLLYSVPPVQRRRGSGKSSFGPARVTPPTHTHTKSQRHREGRGGRGGAGGAWGTQEGRQGPTDQDSPQLSLWYRCENVPAQTRLSPSLLPASLPQNAGRSAPPPPVTPGCLTALPRKTRPPGHGASLPRAPGAAPGCG